MGRKERHRYVHQPRRQSWDRAWLTWERRGQWGQWGWRAMGIWQILAGVEPSGRCRWDPQDSEGWTWGGLRGTQGPHVFSDPGLMALRERGRGSRRQLLWARISVWRAGLDLRRPRGSAAMGCPHAAEDSCGLCTSGPGSLPEGAGLPSRAAPESVWTGLALLRADHLARQSAAREAR